MSGKKNNTRKKQKKFFIIASCYLVVFILTSIITLSTMAWFNSSTWQSGTLYMGGPVYIHFSDDNKNITSGSGKLVTRLPQGWSKMYPGMNMSFEANAVIEGHTFENTDVNGETFTQNTTTAVLRAKIMLKVTPPEETEIDPDILANEIYNYLWPQLKSIALNDTSNPGIWVFDKLDFSVDENNYFYYVEKDQALPDTDNKGEYKLVELGGLKENVYVAFLNNAPITMPPIHVTNVHADCEIKFTIVFEAVQAFFPYEKEEIGTQHQTENRLVTEEDVGREKPLIIKNSRKLFLESQFTEENYPQS